MIILPLVVVVVLVGVVAGSTRSTAHRLPPVTWLGRSSVAVLGVGLVLWALTRTSLPIVYVAVLGVTSFVLAAASAVRLHDRSPLLLIPLLFVPLAAAAGGAFVLLQ
jgi:hypothetical protein